MSRCRPVPAPAPFGGCKPAWDGMAPGDRALHRGCSLLQTARVGAVDAFTPLCHREYEWFAATIRPPVKMGRVEKVPCLKYHSGLRRDRGKDMRL
jgi:hypothetical protein